MKINIQSIHFTAGQGLLDLVEEKVSKLDRLYTGILSADVCLKLDKSDTRENKVCEIRLNVPGNDLFAERKDASFEIALAETIDALQKQIRKMKTRMDQV